MKSIQEITYSATYTVRHTVLRKNKPIESCHFDGDENENTRHFGFFENANLVGILSVFEKNSPLFNESKQVQIRGMAVLDSHQKKGIGRTLLSFVEGELRDQKKELIWFNARVNAVPFYTKLGFKTVGTAFDIPEIGNHFLMYKNINY